MIWTNEMDLALKQARQTVGPEGSWGDVAAGMALLGFDVTRDAVKNRAARLGVKHDRPTGGSWQPGMSWNGTSGTITTGPLDDSPDWEQVLSVWNLDPEVYEVVEPVQFRAWDGPDPEGGIRRFFYYRASVRKRVHPTVDLDALIARLNEPFPEVQLPVDTAGNWTYLVAVADPQLGKKGTAETVERFRNVIERSNARLVELTMMKGSVPKEIILCSLGDVIEGCDSHYAMQTFEVELDRRSQVRLARTLFAELIRALAYYTIPLRVAAVAGNHGENRRNGKAFTSFGDNDDLAVFEQLSEVFAADPQYQHVQFHVPDNDLTLVVETSLGLDIGLAHGHQAKNGDIIKWWRDQTFGWRGLHEADILLTGHFHHLAVRQIGPHTWFQVPTLDSGSQWFAETSGEESSPGILTMTLNDRGWHDLQLLGGA